MGGEQTAVGRHLIALLQQHPIATHQLLRVELQKLAIAPHLHLLRQALGQGLQRALRLEFLPERKQAVDHNHSPDRPSQLGSPRHERQASRHPQQQRHEMEQLIGEPQPPRPLPWGR
jgi:hypothetical protein